VTERSGRTSPTVERLVKDFLAEHPVESTPDRELRPARFDAGLAFVHFDKGFGGLGLDSSLSPLVEQLFLDAGCPDWMGRNVIGLGMAAQTVHTHGTDEQRAKYLKPLFTGEEIWCQLFSEPGAGSDLAALATRAVPTARTTSSTARRSGRRWPTWPGAACSSPAPTPTCPSTGA
jgi:alkylation response protein AidB-like acyl-CoA dehydrogenase